MRLLLLALALASLLPVACKPKPKAEEAPSPPVAAEEAAQKPAKANEPPSLAPMLKRVSPAVVNIAVRVTVKTATNPLFQDPLFRRFFNIPDMPAEREVQGVGSGVIYDAKKGYVITNSHVVSEADVVMVTLIDGRQFKAKIIGTDRDTDIAVLQIDADKLTGLVFGDSKALEVGDYVVAIGNPFGVGQTATFGIVSATGRNSLGIEGYEDFIQTDASINPGNSGGALLDLDGALVGMNTAILSQSGGNIGIGFAIPIDMVRSVADQLIAHGKVTRGQLGVIIQNLTPAIAEAMGLPVTGGAIVTRVLPESSAAKAGIEAGDVITAIDGVPLRNASALRNSVGLKTPGSTVELTVLRKGVERKIPVTILESTPVKSASAPKGSPLDGLKLGPIPDDHPLAGEIEGVAVEEVDPRSPAAEAGIEPDDIIVSANQKPVRTPQELIDIVTAGKGKPLLLNIRRGDGGLFLVLQ